jgi:hypothetical protein
MEGERTCSRIRECRDLRDEGLGAATGVASPPRRLTNQPTKEEPMGEVYLSFSMSLDRFDAGPGDDVVEEAPEGVTSLRFRIRR